MILGLKAALERDEVGQYRLLIEHWLRETASGDLDVFCRQAAGALWLEERFFKNLATIWGAK